MHPLTVALLLVVRSYDVYGVPDRQFRTAKHVAGDILQRAGVRIDWIACTVVAPQEACATVPGPADLILRITSGSQKGQILGQAYVDTIRGGGAMATLYGDRIAKLAQEAKLDGGTLLGRTLAHEIGHLLLGTTAHPTHGLMRGSWSAGELRRRAADDWVFSRDEADEMRRRVAERLGEPAASMHGGPRLTMTFPFASAETSPSHGAVQCPHEQGRTRCSEVSVYAQRPQLSTPVELPSPLSCVIR
jgi:hypothetical protein